MTSPLVSVIVPVYNGARFLRAALESVVAQSYRPMEIIVVDDGSTDASAAIAKSFADVLYLRQTNQGVTAARNAGLAAARGDFLAFLDQDDLWTPGKLRLQVGYLIEHPQVGYVLARMRAFLETGVARPAWVRPELLVGDEIGCLPGTMVVRRSVFTQIGVFDPGYRIGSDTEWLARAKDAGIAHHILPVMLLRWRLHNSNQSGQVALIHTELLRTIHSSVTRQKSKQP